MNYRTIKNCGEVGIEFCNIDSDGARVSRDFLRKLVTNIIRRSTDYHGDIGEPVFFYRERQFHSVVCPSIADITSSYLMEHPLRRRPVREKEFTGLHERLIESFEYGGPSFEVYPAVAFVGNISEMIW